jgi:hypothetical protein
MVNAIVEAQKATNGVAICMPRTSASSGMAINASPNPSAERVNVDIKRIIRTGTISDPKSIRNDLNPPYAWLIMRSTAVN